MARIYVKPKPFKYNHKTIFLKSFPITLVDNEDIVIRLTDIDHIHIESMDILHPKHINLIDNLIQDHFKDLTEREQEQLIRKEIEII